MKRLSIAMVLVAMGAVACGQAASGAASSAGRTVSVGPTDSGSTIHLSSRDKLLLNLGPPDTSKSSWRLALHPERILVRLPGSAQDGFLFKAVAIGQGQVIAFDASLGEGPCGGGNAMGIKGPMRCPMREGDFFAPRPGVFSLKVVVGSHPSQT